MWRLEQTGRRWTWALASARAEQIPIRTPDAADRLSSSLVHQLMAEAGLDALNAGVSARTGVTTLTTSKVSPGLLFVLFVSCGVAVVRKPVRELLTPALVPPLVRRVDDLSHLLNRHTF